MSVIRIDKQIIIEPVQKGVVYIPYYDPLVVYGHWHWYSHPPVSWYYYPYYVPRSYGLFYWSHGVHITFNYYFSAFNWHKQHIVVVSQHHSHFYRPGNRIATSQGAQRWKHKYPYLYGRKPHNNHLHPEINSNSSSREHSREPRDNTAQRLKKHADKKSKVYKSRRLHQMAGEIEEPLTDNMYPLLLHKQRKAEQSHNSSRGDVMRQNSSGYREQKKLRD